MIKDIWRHKISCNSDTQKHQIERKIKLFLYTRFIVPELFQYGKGYNFLCKSKRIYPILKQNQIQDYEIHRNTTHYLMLAKICMKDRVMSS